MTEPKTRFPQVKLEDLKKILPEQVVDGNDNRGNQKDKKKNKQRAGETNKSKSRA